MTGRRAGRPAVQGTPRPHRRHPRTAVQCIIRSQDESGGKSEKYDSEEAPPWTLVHPPTSPWGDRPYGHVWIRTEWRGYGKFRWKPGGRDRAWSLPPIHFNKALKSMLGLSLWATAQTGSGPEVGILLPWISDPEITIMEGPVLIFAHPSQSISNFPESVLAPIPIANL